MDPRITILVPSFNHGSYLENRIESIISQTYGNYELIVIDDRSNDDSDRIIRALKDKYHFEYIPNRYNTGTPFAAWEKIAEIAQGDYIWICESDDYAHPDYLKSAVEAIKSAPDAAIAYCDSWIVDKDGRKIDHTDSYFHDVWKETRWDQSFIQDGVQELKYFQVRGQTVPNMSSVLISKKVFKKAFRPFVKRLKLTGDWLFIGLLMKHGPVVFFKDTLNYYRKHGETARVRVNSARSQAEFMLTKYLLFLEAKKPFREFASVMSTDAVRFLHEPASFKDIAVVMMKISFLCTLRFGLYFAGSLFLNWRYINKFYRRLQIIRRG